MGDGSQNSFQLVLPKYPVRAGSGQRKPFVIINCFAEDSGDFSLWFEESVNSDYLSDPTDIEQNGRGITIPGGVTGNLTTNKVPVCFDGSTSQLGDSALEYDHTTGEFTFSGSHIFIEDGLPVTIPTGHVGFFMTEGFPGPQFIFNIGAGLITFFAALAQFGMIVDATGFSVAGVAGVDGSFIVAGHTITVSKGIITNITP